MASCLPRDPVTNGLLGEDGEELPEEIDARDQQRQGFRGQGSRRADRIQLGEGPFVAGDQNVTRGKAGGSFQFPSKFDHIFERDAATLLFSDQPTS